MHILQVDPHDEVALAAWFAVQQAVERDERPDEVCTLLHEVRAAAVVGSGSDPDSASVLLSALCVGEGGGDEVVGAARLHLPRRDNLHLAEVELYAHPAVRRRGVGRALVTELERVLRADGRTSLIGYTDEPPGRPSAMTQGAGQGLGFVKAQEEVRRDIDLPLDPGRSAVLETEIAPYAADFDVVTWRDAVPEHLLDDLAVLHQRMSTDVPMADLDITEEVFDAPGSAPAPCTARRAGWSPTPTRRCRCRNRRGPTSGTPSCSRSTVVTGWGPRSSWPACACCPGRCRRPG